jgi:hypothetical protein
VQVEAQGRVHRALDASNADLAVALGCVRVAAREEGAGVVHRKEEPAALRKVAGVHVAAERARGHDRRLHRIGGVYAHRPEEGLYGDNDVVLEMRVVAGGEVEDLEVRLGEVLLEQPEAGDDRRPAPPLGVDVEDLHLQDVAGLRTLNSDGASQRV